MGDRQFVRRGPDVHARVVENHVLHMDKFAPNPHACRSVEEVAALDEPLSDRAASNLLIQSGELILRPSNGR